MSAVQSLTNFFQVMYNRMFARAVASNDQTRGTAANPNDVSGNLGGGQVPIGNIAVYPDPKSISYIRDGYSGNSSIYMIVSLLARKFGHLPFKVLEVKNEQAAEQYKHYMKVWDKHSSRASEAKKLFQKAYASKKEYKTFKVKKEVKADSYWLRVNGYRKAVEDNEVYATTTTKDLEALLKRPNPNYGADYFQEYVETYFEACGEAIIWLNRGTDMQDIPLTQGPVLEMYVLPQQYMEMVPDPYNVWGCLGWIFNVAGKRIPIDKENIIHWKKPDPNFDAITRQHQRGMSPMRPARKKITEDESAGDASVAMHQNNGARAIVFDKNITKGVKMTPTQESEIRGVIDRKVNHNDMKGAVAYIQGDLGSVDLSMSSVDQELEDAKTNTLARLCNVWGVSPDLFLQGSTYQNVLQARKDLMTNKVLPAGCSFRDELALKLLPAFGMNPDRYSIDIDATMIPELQDNMLELVQALKAADWLTPDEKREEMNYEPLNQEGTNKLWISNTMVLMEDATMPDQNPDSFDPNADPAAAAQKIVNDAGKD